MTKIIQRYVSPKVISVGDNVKYKGKNYMVLINYIKGDKDRKGFIPTENFTILIDKSGKRTTVHDYKLMEIIEPVDLDIYSTYQGA